MKSVMLTNLRRAVLARRTGSSGTNRDIAGLWDHELLDLYRDFLRSIEHHNPVGKIRGQPLDQSPTPAFTELHQLINDRLIVDRPFNAVADRGSGKVQTQFHCHEQALGLGPLLIGDADMVLHFQIYDRDLRHAQFPLESDPGWPATVW